MYTQAEVSAPAMVTELQNISNKEGPGRTSRCGFSTLSEQNHLEAVPNDSTLAHLEQLEPESPGWGLRVSVVFNGP